MYAIFCGNTSTVVVHIFLIAQRFQSGLCGQTECQAFCRMSLFTSKWCCYLFQECC